MHLAHSAMAAKAAISMNVFPGLPRRSRLVPRVIFYYDSSFDQKKSVMAPSVELKGSGSSELLSVCVRPRRVVDIQSPMGLFHLLWQSRVLDYKKTHA